MCALKRYLARLLNNKDTIRSCRHEGGFIGDIFCHWYRIYGRGTCSRCARHGLRDKNAKRTSSNTSETLKGEVATVDEASGKISIKLSSTVGSSNATTPTYFKVQDGLVFNAIKPGDKVSIVVERTGNEMRIKNLTKD